MSFGNIEYIVYIGIGALIVMAAFAFYIIWKRHVLAGLAQGVLLYSKKRRLIKNICIFVCIILFAFAAMFPRYGEHTREVRSEGSDVLIALDVSRSMLAEDVGTSRLERAKSAIRWIADSLKGDRIGLIVFAGDAFLLCPLTSDTGAFMMFLDSAGVDSVRLQGTNLGAVLEEAARVFQKKTVTSKLLVLVTDGEDHEGTTDRAIEKLKELDVSVYSAGVGSDAGDFIPAYDGSGAVYQKNNKGKSVRTAKNASMLKRLSGYTGGAYFDISESLSGLRFILQIIASQQKNSYDSRVVREPVERYGPFAFLLALLLSFELMLSERTDIKASGGLQSFLRKKLLSKSGKNGDGL